MGDPFRAHARHQNIRVDDTMIEFKALMSLTAVTSSNCISETNEGVCKTV